MTEWILLSFYNCSIPPPITSGPSASINLVTFSSIWSSLRSEVTRIDHPGVGRQICALHFRKSSVSRYSQTASEWLTAAEVPTSPSDLFTLRHTWVNATQSRCSTNHLSLVFICSNACVWMHACDWQHIRCQLVCYSWGILTWGSYLWLNLGVLVHQKILPLWKYYIISVWRLRFMWGHW